MKVAFLTGAATGIGKATTELMSKQGWKVYAGHLDFEELDSSWAGNNNIVPIVCDVTKLDDVKAAADKIANENNGRCDLVFNNAGFAAACGVVEAAAMQSWRTHFEVNFWGPLNVVQEFSPLLREAKGRVINTTSASVYMTIPIGAAYPISKVALKALSMHMRVEMAPFGVEVTSLEPGGVETKMTDMNNKRIEDLWNNIPEKLRAGYQHYFKDGASAIGDNFKMLPPEDFAKLIVKQVVNAKKLKPSYLIGPGVYMMPWLHRLLPEQQVLNIWSKLFLHKH